MTAGVSSVSTSTNIYLDDLRIQGELKVNWQYAKLCAVISAPYNFDQWYCNFPADMFWQIGLKTF